MVRRHLIIIAALLVPAAAAARDAQEQAQEPPAAICAVALERRVETAQRQLESAWHDLDVHGRAFARGFNPHSANFGKEPIRSGTQLAGTMEWRHLQIRRLMVKTGALFPQFNHPMDVPMLLDRMRTRSVPAIDLADPAQQGQTALLEVYLMASPEHRSIGYEYVEALGDLEGDLLSLKSDNPAPEVLANLKRFQEAFPPFMAATKAAIMSPALTKALTWRMTRACERGEPAQEKEE
jgi:hypothetical protein